MLMPRRNHAGVAQRMLCAAVRCTTRRRDVGSHCGEVMKNDDLTAISMALFVTLGFRLSFEHLVRAKNVVLSDLLNPLSVQQASSAAKAWTLEVASVHPEDRVNQGPCDALTDSFLPAWFSL